MTLADLCLAAIQEPHVLAPLAGRRRVAREGMLEPIPPGRVSEDRVHATTLPDVASRIAVGRLRSELKWRICNALALASPDEQEALRALEAACTPTHRRWT